MERGIIKALFYDYKPESVIELLKSDKDGLWLFEELPKIMKWQMTSFDETDLQEVKDEFIRKCRKSYPMFEDTLWPLLYVSELAGKLLVMDERQRMPRVVFEQMLRWNELARFVGEDLLALSWLAKQEIYARKVRTVFTWEDQIPLQSKEWNQYVGCSSLTDLHAHLGTSADGFVIRWVYWMNNCWTKGKLKDERPRCCIAAIIRYYVFRIVNEGYLVTPIEKQDVLDAIQSNTVLVDLMEIIYSQVDSASNLSLKPNIDGIEHWDYAIQEDWILGENTLQSPYMLLAGERMLMYNFLKKLYQGCQEAKEFALFFYLYLLLKVENRKSFIQTNGLIGLSNYQAYKKTGDRDVIDHFGEPKRRYVIQTALGAARKNRLETRISWNFKKKDDKEEEPLLNARIHQSLFGNKKYNIEKMLERVTLVVTNSKRGFDWAKREEYLYKLKNDFDEIIDRAKRNKRLIKKDAALVGIDFSSSDRYARPEVYAPLVRYARKNRFKQFTYHAGEDFYDLMDGLRTIDEILVFLEWNHHCRLGHGLALGVNPYSYYKERGRNVIATRQVLLDNLAWYLSKKQSLRFNVSQNAERVIMAEMRKLYVEIGYQGIFDLDKYCKSMMLRGDLLLYGMKATGLNDLADCAINHEDVYLEALRSDTEVNSIYEAYFGDKDIHQKGEEIVHWKMPRSVERGILSIQKNIVDRINTEHISLETCPTSNYMIGPFKKYDELPLKKFLDELPDSYISVNTDDKGIITTSIENEYALMAVAFHKKGYSKADIKKMMLRISNGAIRSRFF